jgi:DNA-binding transcriptional ArsR family regulator
MKSSTADGTPVSHIAAAIAEPARTRMLYCLMDGHARTGTELAAVAEVSASTASAHLARLTRQKLVKVLNQGRYRYYSLEGPEVATALEALTVLAGVPRDHFVPSTPPRLRAARTCYDHLAGAVAVALLERLLQEGWLNGQREAYEVTPLGERAFTALGLDLPALRDERRRFACACLDWSERKPHVGGALGAALLKLALKRRWFAKDLDSRALRVTQAGRRELRAHFGLDITERPA